MGEVFLFPPPFFPSVVVAVVGAGVGSRSGRLLALFRPWFRTMLGLVYYHVRPRFVSGLSLVLLLLVSGSVGSGPAGCGFRVVPSGPRFPGFGFG